MNRKIMDDKMLKRQQEKVAKTKDRNAPNAKVASKKVGGTIKKMNMGGVMKNRGGTFKGTF